jgi:hypothetical protein
VLLVASPVHTAYHAPGSVSIAVVSYCLAGRSSPNRALHTGRFGAPRRDPLAFERFIYYYRRPPRNVTSSLCDIIAGQRRSARRRCTRGAARPGHHRSRQVPLPPRAAFAGSADGDQRRRGRRRYRAGGPALQLAHFRGGKRRFVRDAILAGEGQRAVGHAAQQREPV